MSDHNVPRPERRRQLPDDVQKRVVVGNKDLNVIAHFGEFGWRAHEIRNRTRVTVPNKDVKPALTQIFCNPASNDAESDYSNVFPGSTCHVKLAFDGSSRLFSLRRKAASRNLEVHRPLLASFI
jgi:hypothetical protein